MTWHPLLLKQLKLIWGDENNIPEELIPFLQIIHSTYENLQPSTNIFQQLRHKYERIKSNHKTLEATREALKKSEYKFRKIFHQSPIGIVLINPEGEYIDVNPSMCEITGYSKEEFLDTHILSITHPDDVYLDKELTRKVFNGEIPYFQIEKRYIRKDGTIRWGKLTATVLWDDEIKEPLCGLGMIEDITEYKKNQQELIKAKEKAEEMNRLKSSFLANMSHEIRTPLNSILGFAEILQNNLKDPKHRDLSSRIVSGGNRLMNTINSILDLSKIESNKLNFNLEDIDVNQETEEICILLKPLALNKGLQLQLSLSDSPCIAYVDSHYYGQIINNLISNAIKFTEEGQITVKIDQTSIKTNMKWCRVQISDTGIGIDKDFLPHIFDEFKQESYGTSRKHEGTGLGLSITKKLVEAMNGKIYVDSKPDVGSTFTVLFPSVTLMETNHQKKSASSNTINALKDPEFNTSTRILLVEDNVDSQFLVETLLHPYCLLHMAAEPEKAKELIAKNKYDLILMDIHLGGEIDGFDLLKYTRNHPPNTETPVIATSAYAMKEDKDEYKSAGFNAYLSKPYKRAGLLETISKWVK